MVCPVLGNTIKSFPQLAKLSNYSFQFYSFADGCGSGNFVHGIDTLLIIRHPDHEYGWWVYVFKKKHLGVNSAS
jgi:hypothetical protein